MMHEIFNNSPYVAKLVKDWYTSKLSETSRESTHEFIELMKERIDGMISSVVDNNPGFLFSMFDENDVYVFIRPAKDNLFSYKIFAGSGKNVEADIKFIENIEEELFETRKQAEKAALIKAMNLLEERNKKD